MKFYCAFKPLIALSLKRDISESFQNTLFGFRVLKLPTQLIIFLDSVKMSLKNFPPTKLLLFTSLQ